MRRAARAIPILLASLALAGCSQGVEATYGRTRGASVNGTGALFELFKARGNAVRTVTRLDDSLRKSADTLVRFAGAPGAPEYEEAAWYESWLRDDPGHRLVYVPRDFDAESEYWAGVLATMPETASDALKERVEARRNATASWYGRLPKQAGRKADPDDWFEVVAGAQPAICAKLGGPWAEGVDAGKAGLTRHDTLREYGEHVLLSGDDRPLVLEWQWPGTDGDSGDGGRSLAVANGSFLLNEPLAHPARRPLASRLIDWADGGSGKGGRKVVFVEGRNPTAPAEGAQSLFRLLRVYPIGAIAMQMMTFLLIACLSRAAILGRPKSDPPSGADRPAAHPEALGALLSKTRDMAAARSLLDAYNRWRHPTKAPATRASTANRRPSLGEAGARDIV